MADGWTAKVDFTSANHGLDALAGPIKESLGRRSLVEGGVLLRDAARANALWAANKEGVPVRGVLANAIYLAYNSQDSTKSIFRYAISWNAKQAPHGHLVEFGHWQTHVVYKAADGNWYTRKDMPLDKPIWIAARPFLRPTLDSYGNIAIRAMLDRAKRELPILIREYANA